VNMESVEQHCLDYLDGAPNPLVAVSELLVHCRRSPECAGLTEQALLDFLRNHDLVRIIEPPAALLDDVAADEQALLEARVILKTRVPTRRQMSQIMEQQMTALADALQAALRHAESNRDAVAVARLRETLARTRLLRDKISELF